jgi:hypothetical protein
MHETLLLALGLIKDEEGRDELAVHIFRAAIGPGHPPAGDDNGPKQSPVDVLDVVHV